MEDFKKIPNYYKGITYGYEARKVVEDFDLNYNLGSSVTYLLRAGKKTYVNNNSIDSAIADIEKTINHLTFELEKLKNGKEKNRSEAGC